MQLEYVLIEDSYDDTTHIRTMTEQTRIPGTGWLIRTTMYAPHQLAVDVTFVPGMGEELLFAPPSP
jgi:hypothetical protein